MISYVQASSPAADALLFESVDEHVWSVRKLGESEAFARLGLKLTTNSTNAYLQIDQLREGTMAWVAEGLVATLNYGFDVLKLSKIAARVRVQQISHLAALDDLGFIEKSRSNEGSVIRLAANRYDYIAAMAQSLMLEHIEDRQWSFGFDNGRRRAGLCSYTDKKITVSKYLSLVHSIDDVRQTVLHEIAHAICGPKEGHSKKWLATAKNIGYRNETYTGEEIAKEFAPYTGLCPNGHRHYRYQRPKRLYSCHICHKGFDKRYMIDWVIRS